MLEPDWLIEQYKREEGIVNEAGILCLACRAEGLQMFQLVCASSLLVGEHEIFTFELRKESGLIYRE